MLFFPMGGVSFVRALARPRVCRRLEGYTAFSHFHTFRPYLSRPDVALSGRGALHRPRSHQYADSGPSPRTHQTNKVSVLRLAPPRKPLPKLTIHAVVVFPVMGKSARVVAVQ